MAYQYGGVTGAYGNAYTATTTPQPSSTALYGGASAYPATTGASTYTYSTPGVNYQQSSPATISTPMPGAYGGATTGLGLTPSSLNAYGGATSQPYQQPATITSAGGQIGGYGNAQGFQFYPQAQAQQSPALPTQYTYEQPQSAVPPPVVNHTPMPQFLGPGDQPGQSAPSQPPQQQQQPGFAVGDQVEVWSKSLNTWCPGVVERLEGPMVHIKFRSPDGNFLTKAVPDGHAELRLAQRREGHQREMQPQTYQQRPPAPEGRNGFPRSRVLVDTEEDIVDVERKQCRIGRLSMAAVHGQNPVGTLSKIDHAGIGNNHANFQYQPHASSVANDIVDEAMHMANYVMNSEGGDLLDKDWPGPGGQDALLTVFKTGDRNAVATAFERLAAEVQQILASQPSLVRAREVPCKVFGDIHGQFRDLLLLLHNYGFPSTTGPTFIFNGDWGDRGRHQLEVIALVFAMKALFPQKVWLLRGNHEDAVQNTNMGDAGLDKECQYKLQHYGQRVFNAIHNAFNWLPLGCVIADQILVVHGGIGDGNWTLDYLANLPPHCCRPLDHDKIPRDNVVYNVLWSDPIPDDGPNRPDIIGVHDSPRDGHAHMIVTFGKDITDRFCARNKLEMIIRSHQAIARGYGYDVMHGGKCVRVFSARDYEGSGNDGCVLHIVEKHGHLLVRPQVVRSLMCPKADG